MPKIPSEVVKAGLSAVLSKFQADPKSSLPLSRDEHDVHDSDAADQEGNAGDGGEKGGHDPHDDERHLGNFGHVLHAEVGGVAGENLVSLVQQLSDFVLRLGDLARRSG